MQESEIPSFTTPISKNAHHIHQTLTSQTKSQNALVPGFIQHAGAVNKVGSPLGWYDTNPETNLFYFRNSYAIITFEEYVIKEYEGRNVVSTTAMPGGQGVLVKTNQSRPTGCITYTHPQMIWKYLETRKVEGYNLEFWEDPPREDLIRVLEANKMVNGEPIGFNGQWGCCEKREYNCRHVIYGVLTSHSEFILQDAA